MLYIRYFSLRVKNIPKYFKEKSDVFFCLVYHTKTNSYTFHPYKYINNIVLQDFFIFAFRFWTFNIREGQCYLKFGRGGLRPNDERGVFVSGSTRDDGCSKFYQKKLL